MIIILRKDSQSSNVLYTTNVQFSALKRTSRMYMYMQPLINVKDILLYHLCLLTCIYLLQMSCMVYPHISHHSHWSLPSQQVYHQNPLLQCQLPPLIVTCLCNDSASKILHHLHLFLTVPSCSSNTNVKGISTLL